MSIPETVFPPPRISTTEPWRLTPLGAAAAGLLAGIAFLIVYPVTRMIGTVLTDAAGPAGLGIDRSIWTVVWNTIIVVAGGSSVALVFGAVLALINERTDGGFRGLGSFMPVAPLMLPSITGVLGWVVLFDPRVGLVNVALRGLFGLGGADAEGPFNIYSMGGLLFAVSIHLVPTVYLVVSAALRNLDPAVEEASRICGAGPLATAWRVTFPAIRPALFEGWLLSLINGIGMFSVPVILGTGARIELISVRIWVYLTNYPNNQAGALALAGAMLLAVLGLRLAQWRFLPATRQAVIGGKGVRSAPTRLGLLRYLTRSLIIVYIVLSLVLPVLALALVSLESFWTAQVPWDRLSLINYQRVLSENPQTFRALANSLLLASIGATAAIAAAGFLMLYAHQRPTATRGRWRQRGQAAPGWKGLVDFVTTLPATLPHSLIAVSFILAFSRAPFDIYGTIWILLLAYLTMEIPYAASAAKSATNVIGKELTEASRIFRASAGHTMLRILLPLAMPGLAAGWVLVFIHILGEVTASAILSGNSNPVVGSVLLDLWRQGNFPMMTAFALIIWLIASLLVVIMLRLNNRSLGRTR
jgi:iron(III) transport system permease protein